MAKVYTKTGDKGTTGLYSGERVSKASLRVEAYGTIDEVQSFLGMARAFSTHSDIQDTLLLVEKQLWALMADIATLGSPATVTEEHVEGLEKIIDSYDEKLPPLTAFVLPGDSKSSSFLHVARTVIRRAERALWRVYEANEDVHESNVRYLNRLSDLCFILARAEDEL